MNGYKVSAGAHCSEHATAVAAIRAASSVVYMPPATAERAAVALASGQTFDYCYGFAEAQIKPVQS